MLELECLSTMFTAIPDCVAQVDSAELSGGARPCALSLQVVCPSLHGPHGQTLLCFSRLTDKAVKEYSAYRSSLLFWALVDLIYNMFKVRSPPAPRVGRCVCPWLKPPWWPQPEAPYWLWVLCS